MSPHLRALIAELIGTFALVFIGALAIVTDAATDGRVGLLGVALAHGLVLSVMISAAGHVSGGVYNPAVAIALWAVRKLDARRTLLYILAQLAGAALAGLLLLGVAPADAAREACLGATLLARGVGFGQGVLIEAVLTFFLMFAIMGTAVDPRGPRGLAGFGIGLVLVFDILAGGPLTGASMNPARSFGPALVGGYWANHLVYWIGPILGAVAAALVYRYAVGGGEE